MFNKLSGRQKNIIIGGAVVFAVLGGAVWRYDIFSPLYGAYARVHFPVTLKRTDIYRNNVQVGHYLSASYTSTRDVQATADLVQNSLQQAGYEPTQRKDGSDIRVHGVNDQLSADAYAIVRPSPNGTIVSFDLTDTRYAPQPAPIQSRQGATP